MDALITTAARSLVAGDPLGVLKRTALRDDPRVLALRGIAMAQLGDLVRAKAHLRSATHGFGPKEAVARARCVVAEAEIGCSGEVLPGAARHQLSTLNKSRTALLMERAHGGERGLRLRPLPFAWQPHASLPREKESHLAGAKCGRD
jgi:hypothetical protein